jgi:hypothetical protein
MQFVMYNVNVDYHVERYAGCHAEYWCRMLCKILMQCEPNMVPTYILTFKIQLTLGLKCKLCIRIAIGLKG